MYFYFLCSLVLDLSILRWAFGKPSAVVSIWLVMKAMAMSAFPLFLAWHSNRHSWLRVPDIVWLFLYITFLVIFVVFPVQEVCQQNLPPASSIIILSEQVLTIMFVITSSLGLSTRVMYMDQSSVIISFSLHTMPPPPPPPSNKHEFGTFGWRESYIRARKNLNSSLPFGQVALKFCLPWTSLWLLVLRFSWQTTCLDPCPLGK